jgi:hypothetical protein
MENQELKYLDDILQSLKSAKNYTLTPKEIHKEVSGYKFQHDYYEFIYNLTKSNFQVNQNLDNFRTLEVALNYLLNKKYIIIQEGQIRISFEGLIFKAKGGYVKENELFHLSIRRSNFAFTIGLLSFALSLIVAFLSLFD